MILGAQNNAKKALVILLFVLTVIEFVQLSYAQSEEERHLIVISIDGCRWDYLQDENLINIRQMMENGTVAHHMIVTNPSMTPPRAHYPPHRSLDGQTRDYAEPIL